MFVDLIGIPSISTVIEQTGLSKFIIYKGGSGAKSTPIFENLNCDSNKDARQIFVNWANSILQGNPTNCNEYELYLFTNIEDGESPDVEGPDLTASGKVRKGKAKANKVRFTFSLCASGSMPVMNGPDYKMEDIAELINNAIKSREEAHTNNEILKRLTDLENSLTEEEEEEEIGEEEDAINKISKVIAQLQGLGINLGIPKVENKLPSVSGPETPARNVNENINKALKILYKNNNQLDLDLLKLADLSENNPSQFNFLINALRKL